MKYQKYRISKYIPECYDENGIYTREEWTSIYDIGKAYNNQVFDEKEYIAVENNYIDVINYLLVEHGIDCLVVSELEMYSLEKERKSDLLKIDKIEECLMRVREGAVLTREHIDLACRAMLREYIWCKLYSQKSHFIISVGYDFYLHLICEELTEEQKNRITSMGLFVTEW